MFCYDSCHNSHSTSPKYSHKISCDVMNIFDNRSLNERYLTAKHLAVKFLSANRNEFDMETVQIIIQGMCEHQWFHMRRRNYFYNGVNVYLE